MCKFGAPVTQRSSSMKRNGHLIIELPILTAITTVDDREFTGKGKVQV